MPNVIKSYVKGVDALNRFTGLVTMHLIFVMIGLLLYSSISRTLFDTPINSVVTISQFLMSAYYLLGGGFSMQEDAHVRMDLFYSRWSPKGKAKADSFTSIFLVFYLVVLLIGAISSTMYTIEVGQKTRTLVPYPLTPIKVLMTLGVFLMLLQATSAFFKDLAKARGVTL
ncbi:C4-dicarboxylate ABC transporter permease [Kiloniella litopenaei]|uniref:TRAP transporter small permease protein n=1 Tax=Kiloniella litopenaei TaxID=1549748 RepID=A0A0M2R5N4_9PROT|nr:TRAP transporter small permease subunit [Kiloniella litopenaei]KKJ75295.1 C4-dicarboxylate ABC transporter permease [Kiloniella litopenaei]